MALALELAASHVGSLGIRGTAELLDNRFGLLWQGRRTALPRHETLNETNREEVTRDLIAWLDAVVGK